MRWACCASRSACLGGWRCGKEMNLHRSFGRFSESFKLFSRTPGFMPLRLQIVPREEAGHGDDRDYVYFDRC